jgi:hypothetical protein
MICVGTDDCQMSECYAHVYYREMPQLSGNVAGPDVEASPLDLRLVL